MVLNHDKNLITEKMRQIIRKETIYVLHFASVIIVALDILDEPASNFSDTLKITSIVALVFLSILGVYRLKKLDKNEGKPIVNIILYSLFITLALLVLADIGSVYVYLAVVPIYLANFYYSNRITYSLIFYFLVISMLQPVIFSITYSADPVEYLTLRNLSINLIDWLAMAVVARLIISTSDVTNEDRVNSRRLADEALTKEKLVSELINAVDVAVIGVSSNGTVIFSNAASHSILDTNKKIIGDNLYDIFTVQYSHVQPVDLRAIMNQLEKPKNMRVYKKYADNSVADLELSIKPILNTKSEIKNLVILIRDVTISNRSDEDRKAFISLLSHELRTPVATVEAVISNTQFMIKSGKSTEKMVEDSLDKSHELIIKLSIALNSVDKFTELQEQDDKIDKEDIPLSEIMNICSEEFKPKSQAKGLEYEQNVAENSDNIVLLSNKSLLVEIVTEITQNAIMYTAEGRVTMDASYSNDHVEIRIVDTGIGISARQLPNLFKAGFQTENHETRSTTGMGLGLYISKKIAERLDITIELNSEIEKGTKVTLSIPAKIVNQ